MPTRDDNTWSEENTGIDAWAEISTGDSDTWAEVDTKDPEAG